MKVSILRRKLNGGRVSLCLSINMADGRCHRRSMGLILERPSSVEARQRNQEKMMTAQRIRAKYELDAAYIRFQLPHLVQPIPLIEAFREYVANYRHKDLAVVKAMGNYLERYALGKSLWLQQVNANFCRGFLDFLLQAGLRGNTPMGYFKKFRAFLASEHRARRISSNPAEGLHVTAKTILLKDVLTATEQKRLFHTLCPNSEVKRAFLFACNTGLRWVDVKSLRMKNIDYQNRRLHLVQHKVQGRSCKAELNVPLDDNAFDLVQESRAAEPPCTPVLGKKSRQRGNQFIFNLPTYNAVRQILAEWVEAAGIRKHITFHCARHSFITNLVRSNVHLSVVASLAGHSTTRHTEGYVHIADTQCRDAVNRLPSLRSCP